MTTLYSIYGVLIGPDPTAAPCPIHVLAAGATPEEAGALALEFLRSLSAPAAEWQTPPDIRAAGPDLAPVPRAFIE